MGVVEIVLIGLALSMDAFAVTISDVFAYPKSSRARLLLLPIAFGIFQGAMLAIGYWTGSLAADLFEQYAGIVSLVLLGFIGSKMIWEGAKSLRSGNQAGESLTGAAATVAANPVSTDILSAPAAPQTASPPAPAPPTARLTLMLIVIQATATSLDALITGVSLLAESANITLAALVVSVITLLSCLLALLAGKRFGVLLGNRAEIVGGLILVLIGLKAFFF